MEKKTIIDLIITLIGDAQIDKKSQSDFTISASAFDQLSLLKSSSMLPLWIPMNKNIEISLSDLITNCRHSLSEEIPDPFSNVPLPFSKIWYTVFLNQNEMRFIIKFANKIYGISDYEKSMRSRHIKTFSDYNLDIALEYKICANNILIAEINFPII